MDHKASPRAEAETPKMPVSHSTGPGFDSQLQSPASC